MRAEVDGDLLLFEAAAAAELHQDLDRVGVEAAPAQAVVDDQMSVGLDLGQPAGAKIDGNQEVNVLIIRPAMAD